MTAKLLKAYFVYDPRSSEQGVSYGEIVFAPTPGRAKTTSDTWVDEHIDRSDYIRLRALRRPQYDRYAERRSVPAAELIADGWHFFCARCGGHVTADNLGLVVVDDLYCDDCTKLYGISGGVR